MPRRKIGKKTPAPKAAPPSREPREAGREHTGEPNLITTKPRLERVTRVIDANTFETDSRTHPVRLSNISVAEVTPSRAPEAKRALERLIDGKLVSVRPRAQDERNRTIAEVSIGRRSVNRAMDRLYAAQNGERLRTLRKRYGLSQQAVADALDLPRTAVTHMESGRRYRSASERLRLARLYGCPESFFLPAGEVPDKEELSVLLHRMLPEMRQDLAVGAAVRRLLTFCWEGTRVRRALGRPDPQDVIPDRAAPVLNTEDAIRQGEAVAEEERRRLVLGNTPIRNIARLLNEQGIWAVTTELPEHLSGFTVVHSVVGLVTLINQRHAPLRCRFAHAHEYAHGLFDRSKVVVPTRRDAASNLREMRANAFAAAFLMPPDGVAEQLERMGKGPSGRRARVLYDVAEDSTLEAQVRSPPGARIISCPDVVALAHHFEVSYEVMVGRLRDLGHIGTPARATLLAQQELAASYIQVLGSGGGSDEEPSEETPNHEFQREFVHLAVEGYRRVEVSRGWLIEKARELGKDGDALFDLVRNHQYPD